MIPRRRVEDIIQTLEQYPEEPLLMVNDAEAAEALDRVRLIHKHTRLIMMHGMRYLAITDRAVGVIIERLERERQDYIRTVQRYDKEIADVRGLLGSDAALLQTRPRQGK